MVGVVLCCGVSACYSLPHFPLLAPQEEKENSCPLFLLQCTSPLRPCPHRHLSSAPGKARSADHVRDRRACERVSVDGISSGPDVTVPQAARDRDHGHGRVRHRTAAEPEPGPDVGDFRQATGKRSSGLGSQREHLGGAQGPACTGLGQQQPDGRLPLPSIGPDGGDLALVGGPRLQRGAD